MEVPSPSLKPLRRSRSEEKNPILKIKKPSWVFQISEAVGHIISLQQRETEVLTHRSQPTG